MRWAALILLALVGCSASLEPLKFEQYGLKVQRVHYRGGLWCDEETLRKIRAIGCDGCDVILVVRPYPAVIARALPFRYVGCTARFEEKPDVVWLREDNACVLGHELQHVHGIEHSLYGQMSASVELGCPGWNEVFIGAALLACML